MIKAVIRQSPTVEICVWSQATRVGSVANKVALGQVYLRIIPPMIQQPYIIRYRCFFCALEQEQEKEKPTSISLYISLLAKNKDQFMTNSQIHKITTRQTSDLYISAANWTIHQKSCLLPKNQHLQPFTKNWPPLWSSGQSFGLQIQRSRVRSPALTDFSE